MSTNPRTILAEALAIAQNAVSLDSENKVPEALTAYCKACDLLSHVLGHSHVTDDRRKLNQIYETYTDRIRLLQALHPRLSSDAKVRSRSDSTARILSKSASIPTGSSPSASTTDDVNEFIESIQNELGVSLREAPQISSPSSHQPGILSGGPPTATSLAHIAHSSGHLQQPPDLNESRTRILTDSSAQPVLSSGLDRNCILPNTVTRQSTISGPLDGRQRRRSSFSKTGHSPWRAASRSQNTGRARSNSQHTSEQVTTSSARCISLEFSARPASSCIVSHMKTQEHVAHANPALEEGSFPVMPSELIGRPYWAMRILLGTFANHSRPEQGVFLTKALHIPHSIWDSSNVKIKGEDEKIQAFQIVVAELDNLGRIDRDDLQSLFECLDGLERAMDTAQAILVRKMGLDSISSSTIPLREESVATTKKTTARSFSRFLKSASIISDKNNSLMVNDLTEYAGTHSLFQQTTAQLFRMAQLIEQVNIHLEIDSFSVKQQMRLDHVYSKAADFFGRVVIKLYLADLAHLSCSWLSARTTREVESS